MRDAPDSPKFRVGDYGSKMCVLGGIEAAQFILKSHGNKAPDTDEHAFILFPWDVLRSSASDASLLHPVHTGKDS